MSETIKVGVKDWQLQELDAFSLHAIWHMKDSGMIMFSDFKKVVIYLSWHNHITFSSAEDQVEDLMFESMVSQHQNLHPNLY